MALTELDFRTVRIRGENLRRGIPINPPPSAGTKTRREIK
jgi:hypothetical protein